MGFSNWGLKLYGVGVGFIRCRVPGYGFWVLHKRTHPHGGLQTFHRKSTHPNAINFRALCGTHLVTLPHGIRPQRILCDRPRELVSIDVPCSGFGSRISGFGFQVSGFGFWVSGFGFRVSVPGVGRRAVRTPHAPCVTESLFARIGYTWNWMSLR